MPYPKIIKLIIIINFLAVGLLLAIGARFISEQIQRSSQIDESKIAEYNVSLDTQVLDQVLKQIKK